MSPSFPLEGGGKLHKVILPAFYLVALFCIFFTTEINSAVCLSWSVNLSVSKKKSQFCRRKSAYNLLLIQSLFSLEKLFIEWTFSVQNKPVALPATAYCCMFAHLLLTCHSPGAEEIRRKLLSSTSWRRLRSPTGFPQLCWMLVQ